MFITQSGPHFRSSEHSAVKKFLIFGHSILIFFNLSVENATFLALKDFFPSYWTMLDESYFSALLIGPHQFASL